VIILDIAGLTLTQEDKDILSHPGVSGVIFFSRNFESPTQIRLLSQQIKQLRHDLMLYVDQEGGRVQRFINGMTRLPPLGSLGKMLDSGRPLAEVKEQSEALGFLMAKEIKDLGIDYSFAPILDLDKGISEIIGDRAFHRDPRIVCSLAESYMSGMARAGMPATGKHFPGHGSVALDSHIGLPEDSRTLNELTDDLAPFTHFIQKNIAAIMTAHIVFPKIDPLPVSFSPFWLKQFLRQQLGFKGTIISDDLSMGGATNMGDYAERAAKAWHAGCDLVLVCNNREGAIQVLENSNI
jgi:beta-N-acetylhexosaminidase